MKATGIVRRIDDLGRVVIPKEIRKTMRINEGSPMEIFTDRQGEIILKKYSPIGEMSLFAKEYAEVLAQTTGMLACITDRDQVVAASGQGSKELTGKSITRELESLITGREGKCFRPGEKNKILVSESQKEPVGSEIIQPVLAGGDGIGSVILISKDQIIVLEILKECWYRQQQDFWDGRWNSEEKRIRFHKILKPPGFSDVRDHKREFRGLF